jgi:hypothetical protein
LAELGVMVTGRRLEPGRAALACRVLETDQWCRRCGSQGLARDTVTRRLAHEPLGWRPTTSVVKESPMPVHRLQTRGAPGQARAAEPRPRLSRRRLRWALEAIVRQHLTIARVAEGLDVAWNTAMTRAAVCAQS